MQPLAIDLFCGLGGWTDGLLAEGWRVIGYDIEGHAYGEHRYQGELVIQDVLALHGSQLKDAELIVASPPCQEYSYMAMPWSRAKALAKWYRDSEHPERLIALNELFDQPARIQREACEAAGRFIPMIQENVCGAQPWVGRAQWHYGSYYLWGDVPALMPTTLPRAKVGGLDWNKRIPGQAFNTHAERQTKNADGSWFAVGHNTTSGKGQNPDGRKVAIGADHPKGGWFYGNEHHETRRHSSRSIARKAASARIAKIPLPLAQWIAHCYHPARMAAA